MARPKAFDTDEALDGAISIFKEHGFEGTSAEMLVRAMGIGRQSLYDTFGDKWQLYVAAVRRYVSAEAQKHMEALLSRPRAIDGIAAMVERVVSDAAQACLGVNSVCEFGRTRDELVLIHEAAGRAIRSACITRIREAQLAGDVAADIHPDEAAAFIEATFAGIRVAARSGAPDGQILALGRLALRALR